MKKMKNRVGVYGASAIVACISVLSVQRGSAQVTVFNDTFGSGSTINSGNAPTANSTSYDTAGSKAYTDSIGANDLNLSLSGANGVEAEALFTTTAVSLQNIGDFIDIQLVFNNTSNLLSSAAGANAAGNQVYIGLFNSGGVAPLTTVGASISTFVSGGVQNWVGYSGFIATNGASSKIDTRTAQSAGADQDLLGNDVSGSNSYDNPKGSQLNGASSSSSATPASFLNGSVYTLELKIWVNGAGSLSETNSLYTGSGTGGTVLSRSAGTAAGTTNVTSSFDGMAFGWYDKGAVASAMDAQSIAITTNIPEPSTWMLVASGLALMVGWVRRRR
jgi:hypothetical protein